MPLYEYLCHRCGKHFDVLQKFADEPLALHPECGGEVERLVSTSAFKFKGSGWYVNDYGKGKSSGRDSGNGHAGKNGGTTDSASETKSESKPDSKSDVKSESKPASTPAPAASVEK
jgi:putative FmdB family regulatory protein